MTSEVGGPDLSGGQVNPSQNGKIEVTRFDPIFFEKVHFLNASAQRIGVAVPVPSPESTFVWPGEGEGGGSPVPTSSTVSQALETS